MAERTPRPRGPDPRAGGKAATPGAAPQRSPQDAPGEGSDGNSETPSSMIPSEEEEDEEEEEEEEERSGHQWRVGDACSTTWAGDGQLYPARLLALDHAAGTCLVQFDGYGNTQEQVLADLLPPRPAAWGANDTPEGEDAPSSWEQTPGARRRRRSRRKGERAHGSPRHPEMMPPRPHALREEEEEDALAAMLMAWYLSGYHTGFYMGLREGRAEAAEPPKVPGRKQKKPPCS